MLEKCPFDVPYQECPNVKPAWKQPGYTRDCSISWRNDYCLHHDEYGDCKCKDMDENVLKTILGDERL